MIRIGTRIGMALAAAALCGLSGLGTAATLAQKFAYADRNHDGRLDIHEARAWHTIYRNFAVIDTNRDGYVTLREVERYVRIKRGKAVR